MKSSLAELYPNTHTASQWDDFLHLLSDRELKIAMEDPSQVFAGFDPNPLLTDDTGKRIVFARMKDYIGWTTEVDGLHRTNIIVVSPGFPIRSIRRITNRRYEGYAWVAEQATPL